MSSVAASKAVLGLNEGWPSNVTMGLSAGQNLDDRLLVLWQLEHVLVAAARGGDFGGTVQAFPLIRARSPQSGASCWDSCPSSPLCSASRSNSLLYGAPAAAFADCGDAASVAVKRCTDLLLLSGGYDIPRPDKKQGGEDAWFINKAGRGWLGVSDGVGEWSEFGCSPRDFAKEMMSGASAASLGLQRAETQNKGVTDPSTYALDALSAGFDAATSYGSATSLVAHLGGASGNFLGIANLGDSGLLVLRRDITRSRQFTVYRRTKEQQHFFNCPFQLSRVPTRDDCPKLRERGLHTLATIFERADSSTKLTSDLPVQAQLYDVTLLEGDLVLMGTDGLFDNLFDHEIAGLVTLALSPWESEVLTNTSVLPNGSFCYCHEFGFATPPRTVAKALAEAAFFRALDPLARTPFGRAWKRNNSGMVGGKSDDITVVAAWVVKN